MIEATPGWQLSKFMTSLRKLPPEKRIAACNEAIRRLQTQINNLKAIKQIVNEHTPLPSLVE